MRIQKNNKQLHFSSLALNKVTLPKYSNGRQIGLQEATITLLRDNDPTDIAAIQELRLLWQKARSRLSQADAQLSELETNRFCNDFLGISSLKREDPNQERLYLALEQQGETPQERILGLMKLRKSPTKYGVTSISYLVTNPEQAFKNTQRSLSGIGQILFAKAVQICRKGKFNEISWYSDNDAFYEHVLKAAGFSNTRKLKEGLSYVIPKEKLSTLQKYFDDKHGTDYLKTPVEEEISAFRLA